MNSHLTDEQMTECLLGEAPSEAAQHIASCGECSSEIGELRRAVAAYASNTRDEAAHAGLPRVTFPRRHFVGAHGLAWAAALALFAIATVLLALSPSRPSQAAMAENSNPSGYADAATYDSDDALLLSIQRDLESDSPQALAPAALLTAERNRVILNMREETRNQ